METSQLITEKVSPFGFDKTVEAITAEAEKREWNVPAVHNLQQSLAKSGKHVKPVKVIEICKPQYSGKMLELNDERIVSVLMPCRISVYEKEDKKTYVALINTEALSAGLPENIAHTMKKASDESFELIDKALK